MLFSNFTRYKSGNAIILKNETPIEYVKSLKYYKDDATGTFVKKEFRWSFNGNYWSSWDDLNQGNITSINTRGNKYLFFEIRYIVFNESSNVNYFSIEYIELSDSEKYSSTTRDTSIISPTPIPTDYNQPEPCVSEISITDANTLCGQSCDYYLWRKNHKGQQPISSITDLSYYVNKISYLENNNILGANNIGTGDASLFYDVSNNLLLFRELKAKTGGEIIQTDDTIYIGLDGSFSGGEINNANNLGIGASIFSYKSIADGALNLRSISSPNNTLNIIADSSNIYIDILNYTNLIKDTSLSDTFIWNNGILDVSVADSLEINNIGIGDVSIFKNKENSDVYFRTIKSSNSVIASYIDNNTIKFDVSIFTNYVKESSLGNKFIWDNGILDVSITAGDPSFNDLYALIQEVSSNVGGVEYDSSNFITSGEDHNKSISDLDFILGLLAPEKPDTLNNKNLQLSGSSLYDAILPTGLITDWYENKIPGDLINNYSLDNTFRITTPDFPNTFYAGEWNNTGSRGILTAHINDTYDASINMNIGTGSVSFVSSVASGLLRFNREEGFGGVNSDFWRSAEAYIEINSQREGYAYYSIEHSLSNESNVFSLRYDNEPGDAVFSRDPSYNEQSINLIYLSGLSYYGIGSIININFEAASGIFKKCYHPTHVARLTSTYGSPLNINPGVVPNYLDSFDTSINFEIDYSNITSGTSYASVTISLYKPTLLGEIYTLNLPKRVNTYSQTRSTPTIEYFTDEYRRILQGGSNIVDTPWDSEDISIFLGNGDHAQVVNGILKYPNNLDYGISFSGNKEYLRRFTKESGGLSGGTLSFNNFNPDTDLSEYGTGDINILLWLSDQNKYYDLGKEFGTGGSGTSRGDAKGAYTSLTSSGIAYSLGTDSMGNETTHINEFVLIVIFRNNNKTITQITSY